jgi:hypothetical protein
VQGAVADCIMTEAGGSFILLKMANVSAFISRANIAANPPPSRFDLNLEIGELLMTARAREGRLREVSL